jgi:predicted nucleic acid-binding protein
MSQFDAMIAGIARSHGATVATRNTADFKNCRIRLINPWLA